ncbi:hypothetical protein RRG08_048520 [Elysia crispata]|uniref:Uncharacterized protein n=1 Tax=Elysia crispata TaxID=231223 RepID=A0AAE1B5W0_9GAST|nr:hypothetical protein RRG08_048520 [Elysia crispata]
MFDTTFVSSTSSLLPCSDQTSFSSHLLDPVLSSFNRSRLLALLIVQPVELLFAHRLVLYREKGYQGTRRCIFNE